MWITTTTADGRSSVAIGCTSQPGFRLQITTEADDIYPEFTAFNLSPQDASEIVEAFLSMGVQLTEKSRAQLRDEFAPRPDA